MPAQPRRRPGPWHPGPCAGARVPQSERFGIVKGPPKIVLGCPGGFGWGPLRLEVSSGDKKISFAGPRFSGYSLLCYTVGRLKYGLAILWDGPLDQKSLNDGYATAVYDCVLIKLGEITKALQKNELPAVEFTVIARDQKDLK